MKAFSTHSKQQQKGLATIARMSMILCFPMACIASSAMAKPLPDIPAKDFNPFEVTYTVGNNVLTAGSARLSLTRQGDEWIYSLSTKPIGVFKLTGKGKIQEVSVIDVIRSGDTLLLHPTRYSYRQDNEKRRSVDAWFNWDANQLTYQRRGEQATAEIGGQVLDRLSITLSVMGALRSGFDQAEVRVFDNGKIKTMEVINEGMETVRTKLGSLETIRVRSRNRDGGSRQTLTWFAPSLNYVPVKIEQLKRGELVARLKLTSLKDATSD